MLKDALALKSALVGPWAHRHTGGLGTTFRLLSKADIERACGNSHVPGRNVFPVQRLVSIAARAWLLSVTESFVLPPVTGEAPCHKMLSLSIPTLLSSNAHPVRSATDR